MVEERQSRRPWKIAKRLSLFIGTIFLLIILFKGLVYFMPFFIAGIIALIIEPIIKLCMNKFKWTRRLSSTVIITLTIIIIITLIVWGGIFAANKIVEFSKEIGPFIARISSTFENEIIEISNKLSKYIPHEVIDIITTSIIDFVSNAGTYLQNLMAKVLQFILSVPTLILNVIVAILALVFFSKDKIYIIDSIEHHIPKKWIKKVSEVLTEIFTTLGDYVKVYGKILILTFVELFLSFSILKAIGFNINNILLLSFIIALVDILPVLGVGTVLIPWTIWQLIIGNVKFGIALGGVYLIILTVRQLIEPKLVSKQLGVHPLTTLVAMYAGFKNFGFSGLILGPIILMILKCIFAKPIEKGFFKELFDSGT